MGRQNVCYWKTPGEADQTCWNVKVGETVWNITDAVTCTKSDVVIDQDQETAVTAGTTTHTEEEITQWLENYCPGDEPAPMGIKCLEDGQQCQMQSEHDRLTDVLLIAFLEWLTKRMCNLGLTVKVGVKEGAPDLEWIPPTPEPCLENCTHDHDSKGCNSPRQKKIGGGQQQMQMHMW